MQEAELVSKLPVVSSLPVGNIEEEAAEPYIINADVDLPQKYPGTLLVGLILIGIILIPATSVISNEFSAWYMGRHHKDTRPPIVRLAILLFFLILGFGVIYFLFEYTQFFVIPSEKTSVKRKSTSKEKPLPHPLNF